MSALTSTGQSNRSPRTEQITHSTIIELWKFRTMNLIVEGCIVLRIELNATLSCNRTTINCLSDDARPSQPQPFEIDVASPPLAEHATNHNPSPLESLTKLSPKLLHTFVFYFHALFFRSLASSSHFAPCRAPPKMRGPVWPLRTKAPGHPSSR